MVVETVHEKRQEATLVTIVANAPRETSEEEETKKRRNGEKEKSSRHHSRARREEIVHRAVVFGEVVAERNGRFLSKSENFIYTYMMMRSKSVVYVLTFLLIKVGIELIERAFYHPKKLVFSFSLCLIINCFFF